MPVFPVEVVEVVVYRGQIEADDEEAACHAALADLIARSGDGRGSVLRVGRPDSHHHR